MKKQKYIADVMRLLSEGNPVSVISREVNVTKQTVHNWIRAEGIVIPPPAPKPLKPPKPPKRVRAKVDEELKARAIEMIVSGADRATVCAVIGIKGRTFRKWKKEAGLTVQVSEARKSMLKLINDGNLTNIEIAELTGLTSSHVYIEARRIGATLPKPGKKHKYIAEVKRLLEEGQPGYKIAEIVGLSERQVYKWIAAENLVRGPKPPKTPKSALLSQEMVEMIINRLSSGEGFNVIARDVCPALNIGRYKLDRHFKLASGTSVRQLKPTKADLRVAA